MASVNKVILVGNLGADPEGRFLPSGEAVTNLRIATTEVWKDKSGEKQERTEWHSVALFGRLAEIASEYLKKGRSVYIEGRLRTRKWQDKEGNDRYTTEIVASEMQMLGSPGERGDRTASFDREERAPSSSGASGGASGGPSAGAGGSRTAARPAKKPDDLMDDDIPF